MAARPVCIFQRDQVVDVKLDWVEKSRTNGRSQPLPIGYSAIGLHR